ncbi:hypothetical protein DPMN_073512 [Dreissena polymorpha]|uniref:Uncharacterized protein n=1 Tax=Dreissena polymorpha TaxID=45954 RepID=A0A9D4HB58_DREPO|nr:hypothetical protein DPMN_073512 [Dreissena polymorpha]
MSIEDHLYAVRDDRINIICWKSPRICQQSVTRTVRHSYLDSRFRAVVTDITIKDHFFGHEKRVRRKAGPLIRTETLYKKAP